MRHQQLGKIGEDFASAFLQNKGYSILQRNFKARYGEIDIIAIYQEILIFVEVKTRTSIQFGTPEEAVTSKKLQEIIKTSEYYLLLHPFSSVMRIDVISLLLNAKGEVEKCTHLENVSQ